MSRKREPRGRSPSTPPAPTRPHPAAPTPDQLGCVRGGVGLKIWIKVYNLYAAPTVRVHSAAPTFRVDPAAPTS